MKIQSDFAILDVKWGRHALYKRFRTGDERIPVTITGWLDGINSEDDGTSREFTMIVESVKTHDPSA